MKRVSTVFWVASLWVVAALLNAVALAASPASSPLVGRWVLEVDSLPMPPAARPKHVSVDFSNAADGTWVTRVDIIEQSGNAMYSQSTLSLDGTPGTAQGTYWLDVVAAKMPAPNVLVMQFVYEGVPRSTRVYSVSEDGQQLTETEAYFKDGTPMMRTALFKRAAP